MTAATRFLRLLVALPLVALTVGGLPASAAPTKAGAGPYRILLSSDRDGRTRAYSMLPDGSGLTPLLRSALKPLALSRDGRMIAYEDRRYALYASRADGAGLRRLAPQTDGVAAFSPNGRLLGFAASDGIRVVGMDGRVLQRMKSEGYGSDDDWDWSPGGKAIAYGTEIDDNERYALIVQPLRGKRRVLLRTGPSIGDAGVGGVTWSPDGHWIAYVNGEDAERQHGVWVVRPNGERLHRVAPGSAESPVWSPDGRWIAYTNDDRDLLVVRPSGEARHRVASDISQFTWSPDGKALAFAADSDVAVVDLDGRISWRLHLDQADVSLTWSPDGRRLALADLYRPAQIWVVGSDGSGLQRLTSQGSNELLGWTRLAPVLPQAPELAPTERVLAADTVATRAPVALLSADGPSVAFVAKATATDCAHVAVWTPGEASIRRLGPLPAPCSVEPAHISDLALAGSRAAWAANQPYGRDSCEYMLTSATLADSKPLALTSHAGAPCNVQDYHHLRGHGDLLVFNDGSRLVRIGTGREQCEEQGQSTPATICATLRRGADASPVDSVSGDLIAIRKPGAVTVLDERGTLVRVFPFAPADVSAARVDDGHLVVWRFGVLESYDVATGARELSRPMPTGYRFADLDGGIAVLLSADKIMLLRLGDGRSLTLTPGRGSVLADLEPAGLYYSYAPADGGGRVVFVPRAEVVRQLEGTS